MVTVKNYITNFLSILTIFIIIGFLSFFPKMYGSFPFKFQDLLAIQGSFVQIHLVMLTLILAVSAFFGFHFIKETVEKKVAKQLDQTEIDAHTTAREIAKLEVDKRMSEIEDRILKLVERYPQNGTSLGSPLHSASDSRKSEEIEEVYSDE